MGPGLAGGRVSRRAGPGWSGLHGGFQLVDPGRRVDFQGVEDVALGLGDLGALPEGAGGAGEGPDVDAVELAAQVRPGAAAGVLGDPGEEEGEPAEQDVGADALFFPVVDGAQVDDLLHVPPAALHFEQLLVAQGDVLGAHLGVGCPQQVLAVEVLLGFCLGGVGAQQSAGSDAQVPVQSRLGGDHAAQLGALVPAELVRTADHLGELGDHAGADGGVAFGSFRVEADDEPLVLGDADLLDLEVARGVLVAALPGQGRFGFGGAGAEFLSDDVGPAAFAQVAAVFRGGEAAVGDPDNAGQAPVAHVVLHLADQRGVIGVPGPAPDPDRDPVPGHGHPDHDLGQVIAVVLGLPVGAEPGVLAVFRVILAGEGVAVLVARDRLVGLFGHEVGGGGVEEQQVDLEVQQVGEVVVDLPLQLLLYLQQPVHGPVAG